MSPLLIELAQEIRQRSPFYREFVRGDGIEGDCDVPFSRKQDLLDDQAACPPFGRNLCIDRNQIVRLHRTSGTSSTPLLLAFSRRDLETVVETGSRAFRIAGVRPDDVIFNCMNYCMWMGGFTDHLSLERAGACVVPYGVGNTEGLVRLLIDIDEPSIHATPSYLSVIREVLQDRFGLSPIDLGLKNAFLGGEPGLQDVRFRQRIEKKWGASAVDANYGMSEVMSIMGAEGPQRAGLHFVAGGHLTVELVDRALQTVDIERGASGELVVTTLHKEAQPLLRYRTGDVIQVLSDVEHDASSLSFRFRVTGRADQMLVINGINFYPDSLKGLLSQYPELSGNYQIVLPPSEPYRCVKVLVECSGTTSASSLADELRRHIRKTFFVSAEIELRDRIARGGNKMKTVVSS